MLLSQSPSDVVYLKMDAVYSLKSEHQSIRDEMESCYSITFEPVERLLQERSACVFAVSSSGLQSAFGAFPPSRFLPGAAGSRSHARLDGREDKCGYACGCCIAF
jgi:hypothetical protein